MHPRRTPAVTRNPVPAVQAGAMPTTVVERRPSPAVGRVPVPADIAVNPSTALTVGTPTGIDHSHGWTPDPAVFAVVNPITVRGE